MKLPVLNQQNLIIGGVVVVGLYFAVRGFKGVAKDATKAAVNIADGAVAGTAVGIGEVFGLPETSKTQCEIDQANGDQWAASTSCSAGKFLKGLF